MHNCFGFAPHYYSKVNGRPGGAGGKGGAKGKPGRYSKFLLLYDSFYGERALKFFMKIPFSSDAVQSFKRRIIKTERKQKHNDRWRLRMAALSFQVLVLVLQFLMLKIFYALSISLSA